MKQTPGYLYHFKLEFGQLKLRSDRVGDPLQ